MQEELIELKTAIRDVLLNVMIDPKNKFEKREYFITSQLLWAIDNYPNFGIPFTRFGILTDFNSYYYELVIRFEENCLILAKEGAERTAYGSDSFETQYLQLDHKEVFKNVMENKVIDLSDLQLWYTESKVLIGKEDMEYTIEYVD